MTMIPGCTVDITQVSASSASAADIADKDVSGEKQCMCGYSLLPEIPVPQVDASRSRSLAEARSVSRTVTAIDPVEDSTVKYIWLTKDNNQIEMEKVPATLRAKGNHCYVWVVDAYYSDTAGFVSITSAQAHAMAEKFDAVYELERNICGEELDQMYYYTGSEWAFEDMSVLSDTGTMVNIVITDIENDGDASGSANPRAGYFHTKDYCPSAEEYICMVR